ncbi:hypothetical protein K501DRAFT_331691 [Backusella circina FSU 941]|nr:hypothetical protein K501DRAFT_331691 [Backusella circina FSU 941]
MICSHRISLKLLKVVISRLFLFFDHDEIISSISLMIITVPIVLLSPKKRYPSYLTNLNCSLSPPNIKHKLGPVYYLGHAKDKTLSPSIFNNRCYAEEAEHYLLEEGEEEQDTLHPTLVSFLQTHRTRSVSDLKGVEQKLESLVGIRSTFNSDPQKSVAVDSLDSTINDLRAQVQDKKAELQLNEEEVQKRFRTMVEALTETCVNKSNDSHDHSTQTLLKFSTNLKESVSKEHSRLNSEVEKLKEQVEAAKQKEIDLKKELADTKASLLQQQEQRFDKVKEIQTTQFKKLNDKVDNYVSLVDKEKLAKHVTDKVQTYVNKYREEQQHQQQGSSSSHFIPNNIKEYITKEINIKLEQLKPPANATIAQEQLASLEKTTADLSKLIEAQKEKAEATHKALVNFKPSQGDNNNQARLVTKHMEEVERHITVMYHNIKMVENFINFKVNNIAGGLNKGSRKRARLENGEMDVDANEDEDISVRLAALEDKHQQMIDFVVQFRDNVLDPVFPSRMEAALSKIEQVLLNHETFLSFLIDPFSTQQNLQKALPSSESSNNSNNNNNNSVLDPSLIQAITELVRKTNDEVALPLENKIRELEQKLSARRATTQ